MGAQCLRGVLLRVKHLGDVAERETEVSQKQNPLQSHERLGSVVAVSVRSRARGRQDADGVVMPQGSRRHAGPLCYLVDAPFRHGIHGRS